MEQHLAANLERFKKTVVPPWIPGVLCECASAYGKAPSTQLSVAAISWRKSRSPVNVSAKELSRVNQLCHKHRPNQPPLASKPTWHFTCQHKLFVPRPKSHTNVETYKEHCVCRWILHWPWYPKWTFTRHSFCKKRVQKGESIVLGQRLNRRSRVFQITSAQTVKAAPRRSFSCWQRTHSRRGDKAASTLLVAKNEVPELSALTGEWGSKTRTADWPAPPREDSLFCKPVPLALT